MTNQFIELHESNFPHFIGGSELPGQHIILSKPLNVFQPNVEQGLDFRYEVAYSIARIPEVRAVFTSKHETSKCEPVFFVWIIVPERDYDVYERLFEVERSLINKEQGIQFDFTIMPCGDKDPRTMVTDPEARLIYVRE
jgi:hypothetical protein